MRIGIIGSGNIGGTLARRFVDAGHEVAVSNSRGPETLAGPVEELGPHAEAVTAAEAERVGEFVVVSVPFGRYRELPTHPVSVRIRSTPEGAARRSRRGRIRRSSERVPVA